jgi:hypothetical protein
MAQNNVEYDRDKIIMALVKMRIDKFATTKTMLEFLQDKPFKYKDSYAYELIREAKKKIVEIFKEEHSEEFETYRARLEEIIETTKSEKVRLDSIKEMNKLLGLYKPTKVDITSGGEKLFTGIDIKIITNDDKGSTQSGEEKVHNS